MNNLNELKQKIADVSDGFMAVYDDNSIELFNEPIADLQTLITEQASENKRLRKALEQIEALSNNDRDDADMKSIAPDLYTHEWEKNAVEMFEFTTLISMFRSAAVWSIEARRIAREALKPQEEIKNDRTGKSKRRRTHR